MTPTRPSNVMRRTISGFQLNFPVSTAHELPPGFAPEQPRHVGQRPPRRLPWDLPQLQSCHFRRSVGLPLIALHAGEDAVLPRGDASPRAGNDMVHRQLLRPRLGAAVLASVVIPLEEV